MEYPARGFRMCLEVANNISAHIFQSRIQSHGPKLIAKKIEEFGLSLCSVENKMSLANIQHCLYHKTFEKQLSLPLMYFTITKGTISGYMYY